VPSTNQPTPHSVHFHATRGALVAEGIPQGHEIHPLPAGPRTFKEQFYQTYNPPRLGDPYDQHNKERGDSGHLGGPTRRAPDHVVLGLGRGGRPARRRLIPRHAVDLVRQRRDYVWAPPPLLQR
jgi:hypothetical protein